jgi:hypothetical protein
MFLKFQPLNSFWLSLMVDKDFSGGCDVLPRLPEGAQCNGVAAAIIRILFHMALTLIDASRGR